MITFETFSISGERIPESLRGNVNQSLMVLNDVLAQMPELRFSGGYRSAAKNAAVGGVANSRHVQGLAFDVVSRTGSYPQTLIDKFASIVRPYGYGVLLHNVGSGLHLHSELRGNFRMPPKKKTSAAK